jgi:hypothetical protein
MNAILMRYLMHGGNKSIFTLFLLLLSTGLMIISCGKEAEEAIDNFDSRVACEHYCDRAFECANADPSSEEIGDCISDCRDSIENNCGNEHQAEANDKIEDCVDENCVGFGTCMVFEAAPECFGFVSLYVKKRIPPFVTAARQ